MESVAGEKQTRENATELDLEEFKSLREEILQKVEASYRLEIIAVSGAAAVYAWLATRPIVSPPMWLVPIFFPIFGFLRAQKMGHQMLVASDYLKLLERRIRPSELSGEKVGSDVHGWETYLHQKHIWRSFRDWSAKGLWGSFFVVTLVLSGLFLWQSLQPDPVAPSQPERTGISQDALSAATARVAQ